MKKNALENPLKLFSQFICKIYACLFVLIASLIVPISLFIYGYGSERWMGIALFIFIGISVLFYISLLYYQDKIAEQIATTQQNLRQATNNLLEYAQNIAYLPPSITKYPICNRLIGFFTWHPFFVLKESLYLTSIESYIQQIKLDPINLQTHASLAHAYIILANHYEEPSKTERTIWLSSQRKQLLLSQKRRSSEYAIEELSILRTLAPSEIWVHDQLAISYRELDMPDEEIKEYETLVHLCPNDASLLLRLGTLYFQKGENAKGLEIYGRLNTVQPILAEALINHYGAYTK